MMKYIITYCILIIVVGNIVLSCKNDENKLVVIDSVLTKDSSSKDVVANYTISNLSNAFEGFVCDTICRPKGCKDNIFAYAVLYAINRKLGISNQGHINTDSADWRKCVKLLNFKANKGIIVLKYVYYNSWIIGNSRFSKSGWDIFGNGRYISNIDSPRIQRYNDLSALDSEDEYYYEWDKERIKWKVCNLPSDEFRGTEGLRITILNANTAVIDLYDSNLIFEKNNDI